MVVGAEWLMQLGVCTTNLEEQFMEFHFHGKHYKLYGNEGSILKEGKPKQQEKNEEAQKSIGQQS